MATPLELNQESLNKLISQLETARQHAEIALRHFGDNDVPRACAHLFAAQGNMIHAQNEMNALAVVHESKSRIV